MSRDEERHEALRWLETGREDLDVARLLLEQGKYSHACFCGQQAAEKALKALWYGIGADPWGHSIQKLIAEIPDERVREAMDSRIEDAAFLDRFYIPTRYPNGLPDLTPGKTYFRRDAEACIGVAERIVETAASLVP